MVFHYLTAVLILLKVLDIIAVSWLVVLAPSLVAFTIALLVMTGVFSLAFLAAWK